jgi:SAM-dependent methyltransferase
MSATSSRLRGGRARAQTPTECPPCPLCGGSGRHALTAADLNRGIGRERFEYARCSVCGSYFLSPAPVDMSPYYPREYYNLPSAHELDRLAESQSFVVGLLLDHTEPGRLLEVGPGEGLFARAARNAGFEVTAIEMDPRACEHLRGVVGVQAIESATPEQVIPTLPPSRAIVMWHVIEHLRRPWDVIERAAANLEAGGVLAIATPNPHALQFRLLGRRWAHLDAPRHLFLIPAATLERRCRELGLRLAATSTDDPAGRHWNRFGWEYAMRRAPRSRPATRTSRALSMLVTRALRPIEGRADNGCAYTSIFVKLPST